MTEAISLGHDLGHTPFGHAGERALDAVMEGGFRHYEQSARVVERLENDGRGLNLTVEVRDGIRCHTRGTPAMTLEGRIVRLADRVAYINHDIDDAVRAGVISGRPMSPDIRKAGGPPYHPIDTLVRSIVENSGRGYRDGAGDPGSLSTACTLFIRIPLPQPRCQRGREKVEGLITRMFAFLWSIPTVCLRNTVPYGRTRGSPRGLRLYRGDDR